MLDFSNYTVRQVSVLCNSITRLFLTPPDTHPSDEAAGGTMIIRYGVWELRQAKERLFDSNSETLSELVQILNGRKLNAIQWFVWFERTEPLEYAQPLLKILFEGNLKLWMWPHDGASAEYESPMLTVSEGTRFDNYLDNGSIVRSEDSTC